MITFLKRRFSSGDLQGELADKREQEGLPDFLRFGSNINQSTTNIDHSKQVGNYQQQAYANRGQQFQNQFNDMSSANVGSMYGNQATHQSQANYATGGMDYGRKTRSAYPSAPTSPTRSSGVLGSSFMGPMGSITGQISSTLMRGFSTAASTAQNMATGKMGLSKDQQKVLLVIDDSQIDWGKYFRGKKLSPEWDIKVEQAQFSELTMTAYSERGCVVSIYPDMSSAKPVKSFKPDFVLIRQHVSGLNENWEAILTGLMYGGTPCLNTLHAIYNMRNKPWLFAHLLMLRNRLGKETFPLISQTYHTSCKEMVVAPSFPLIIKVGSGHRGEGKIRADHPTVHQDILSLVGIHNTYATAEPFVDANCDIHIQKIGNNYKVFMRKSITGNWKSNLGSTLLEKVPLNDKFKVWIEEVAHLFGGLDICSVDALQTKTGEYFIYEVNGSDMCLYGDSQEIDRNEIAELVAQKMQNLFQSKIIKSPSVQSIGRGSDIERPIGSTMHPTPIHSGTTTTTTTTTSHYSFNQPQSMTSVSNIQQQQPQHHQQQQQQQQQPQHTMFNQQSYKCTTNQNAMSPPNNRPFTTTSPTMSYQSESNIGTSFGSSSGSLASSRFDTPQHTGMDTPVSNQSKAYGGGGLLSEQNDFGGQSNTVGMDVNFSSVNWNQTGGTGSMNATSDLFGMKQTATGPATGNLLDGFDSLGQTGTNKFSTTTTANRPPMNSSMNINTTNTMDRFNNPPPAKPTSQPERPNIPARQTSIRSNQNAEDTDDTMKNLRKTFAGIFGDM